eukprot:2795463-Lingulodinium_polyedra.AAC.1
MLARDANVGIAVCRAFRWSRMNYLIVHPCPRRVRPVCGDGCPKLGVLPLVTCPAPNLPAQSRYLHRFVVV